MGLWHFFIMENHMAKYSFAQPTPKATNALKAVLMIFNSDPHLMKAVRPYIDMAEEEIDWNGINAIGFNKSKQCAVD